MLPLSYVELQSVKPEYSHIAPEFQARITLNVMPVRSLRYMSPSTSISVQICDFHLSDNCFRLTGHKLSHAASRREACGSIKLMAL